MESLFLFLATSLALQIKSSTFKRYLIGNNGCTALLFSESNHLQTKYTADGDVFYFNDATLNGVRYGLIYVEMKDLLVLQQAETILVHYLKQVRRQFGIQHNIAVELKKRQSHLTATDYWQDEQGSREPTGK